MILHLNSIDTVAIAKRMEGLHIGDRIDGGIIVRSRIEQGHKIAMTDIQKGKPLIRYGHVIGYALRDIGVGEGITKEDIRIPEPPALDDISCEVKEELPVKPLKGYTFYGYPNRDGSVATRNILGISTTVQCTKGVVDELIIRIRKELLPHYPHVDGVVAINHPYGCGVAIDAPQAAIPIRTIRNISRNPNVCDELMVVSLGCEKMRPDMITDGYDDFDCSSLLTLQDEHHIGFEGMIRQGMKDARFHLERLEKKRRVKVPASHLIIGLQCGGSDALSGVTANPLLGKVADLIVRAGGTVIFSEITEVRDVAHILAERCADATVCRKLIDEFRVYDAYLSAGGADRSANTTPGNKAGGLANITEKALGSFIKSGSSQIKEVLSPGEKATKKGLIFAATPASDFIAGTLQLAAGMNIHLFSTGRGTPYNLSAVPVMKIATHTSLASRWYDLIDVDAGKLLEPEQNLDKMAMNLFEGILSVASGKQTAAEKLGLENDLVLFAPGPVT